MNFIKRFFTGMKQDVEPKQSVAAEEVEKKPLDDVTSVESEPPSEAKEESNFPPVRSVLQISAISEGVFQKTLMRF